MDLEDYIKKQNENIDSAIKVIEKSKHFIKQKARLEYVLEQFEKYLDEMQEDKDIGLICIAIHKKLIELNMKSIVMFKD